MSVEALLVCVEVNVGKSVKKTALTFASFQVPISRHKHNA